ncbi:MAG: hypothetical protein ACO1SX_28665 [Actinomycetota bacterium]
MKATYVHASRNAGLILSALLLAGGFAQAAPQPPPGFNVHLVRETESGRFWRGGAPKPETVAALARSAKERGVSVTFVDLRKPANSDDRSGKANRLSPSAEEAAAKKLGLRYLAISALDRELPSKLNTALQQGDIYMHCMYGVNRTGFATARYARANGVKVPDKGLGKRDWKQGDAFQLRVGKK